MTLSGKVAFIAGAGSSGPGWSIGKAVSVTLAKKGVYIVALDLNLKAAQETCLEIQREGGQSLALQADVTDASGMAVAVDTACEHFGGIDFYIANAGIGKIGGINETTEADFSRIQAVNVNSLLIGSKLLIPKLLQRESGVIVTVASIAGMRYIGYPHLAYSVTKAAVIHFTRMLAQEYADQGLRANTVIPGLIDTPRVQTNVSRAFSNSGDIAEVRCKRERQVPMGRMGTPFEVAKAITFLCSNDATYITGTELIVDGGLTGRFHTAQNY